MTGDPELREILSYPTVAVVGCSPKESRPSHAVALYLRNAGYRVIPVNPGFSEILGEKCYPNLLQIPEKVDVVDVFRRSEEVLPIVRDAVRIGAKAVWLQDGVAHPAGEEEARRAGLKVVSNDCMMREHRRLGGPGRKTVTTC